MRYFFRRTIPAAKDVLLIESGSPEVALQALEGIRKIFPRARYHLCTCQAEAPPASFTDIFRATDYPTTWKKLGLLFSFCRRGWNVLVILCTGEPILWRWKMLAVLMLPAKVLVVNENADFFWLDWGNLRTLRSLAGIRWGVNLEEFFYTVLRGLIFPLTFLFLLATAGLLYLRRGWRLALWSIQGARTQSDAPREPSPACGDAPRIREP